MVNNFACHFFVFLPVLFIFHQCQLFFPPNYHFLPSLSFSVFFTYYTLLKSFHQCLCFHPSIHPCVITKTHTFSYSFVLSINNWISLFWSVIQFPKKKAFLGPVLQYTHKHAFNLFTHTHTQIITRLFVRFSTVQVVVRCEMKTRWTDNPGP